MKKAICILSVLAILLCAWLVLLWLPALLTSSLKKYVFYN